MIEAYIHPTVLLPLFSYFPHISNNVIIDIYHTGIVFFGVNFFYVLTRKEELKKQKEEDERRKQEQEETKLAFEKDKKAQIDMITSLEHELLLEKEKRATIEQQMADEIAKLQGELSKVKIQNIPNARSISTSGPSLHPSLHSAGGAMGSMTSDNSAQELLRELLTSATNSIKQREYLTFPCIFMVHSESS